MMDCTSQLQHVVSAPTSADISISVCVAILHTVYRVLPRTKERIAIWSEVGTPRTLTTAATAESVFSCFGITFLGAGRESSVSASSSKLSLNKYLMSSPDLIY